MIKHIKSIGLLSLILSSILSCENGDDNTGASEINYSKQTITVSTENSDVTINEKLIDEDNAETFKIPVTISLKDVVTTDAYVDLYQKSGNASESDYVMPSITIPAGAKEASGVIEILKTGEIEGIETLVVGAKARANFNIAPFDLTITIADDYINHVIDFKMDWAGSYSYQVGDGDAIDVTIDFCKIDFDMILLDSDGNPVDNGNQGYILGSAGCPEEDAMNTILEDGTYKLLVDLSKNPYAELGTAQNLPLKISYSQEYFISGNFVVNHFTTNDANASNKEIATLEVKDGYIYTIKPIE